MSHLFYSVLLLTRSFFLRIAKSCSTRTKNNDSHKTIKFTLFTFYILILTLITLDAPNNQ